MPDETSFPYVVRVVSEIFGSNGSSSMASTCGSTLALMDAGVRLKKPVAGIAMGLASEGEKWKLLTDLQDIEDGPGGMDFKIAGTCDGVTAIQMDTKTDGLTWDIVDQTFSRSREARFKNPRRDAGGDSGAEKRDVPLCPARRNPHDPSGEGP